VETQSGTTLTAERRNALAAAAAAAAAHAVAIAAAIAAGAAPPLPLALPMRHLQDAIQMRAGRAFVENAITANNAAAAHVTGVMQNVYGPTVVAEEISPLELSAVFAHSLAAASLAGMIVIIEILEKDQYNYIGGGGAVEVQSSGGSGRWDGEMQGVAPHIYRRELLFQGTPFDTALLQARASFSALHVPFPTAPVHDPREQHLLTVLFKKCRHYRTHLLSKGPGIKECIMISQKEEDRDMTPREKADSSAGAHVVPCVSGKPSNGASTASQGCDPNNPYSTVSLNTIQHANNENVNNLPPQIKFYLLKELKSDNTRVVPSYIAMRNAIGTYVVGGTHFLGAAVHAPPQNRLEQSFLTPQRLPIALLMAIEYSASQIQRLFVGSFHEWRNNADFIVALLTRVVNNADHRLAALRLFAGANRDTRPLLQQAVNALTQQLWNRVGNASMIDIRPLNLPEVSFLLANLSVTSIQQVIDLCKNTVNNSTMWRGNINSLVMILAVRDYPDEFLVGNLVRLLDAITCQVELDWPLQSMVELLSSSLQCTRLSGLQVAVNEVAHRVGVDGGGALHDHITDVIQALLGNNNVAAEGTFTYEWFLRSTGTVAMHADDDFFALFFGELWCAIRYSIADASITLSNGHGWDRESLAVLFHSSVQDIDVVVANAVVLCLANHDFFTKTQVARLVTGTSTGFGGALITAIRHLSDVFGNGSSNSNGGNVVWTNEKIVSLLENTSVGDVVETAVQAKRMMDDLDWNAYTGSNQWRIQVQKFPSLEFLDLEGVDKIDFVVHLLKDCTSWVKARVDDFFAHANDDVAYEDAMPHADVVFSSQGSSQGSSQESSQESQSQSQ
jgi:hypothetical protein